MKQPAPDIDRVKLDVEIAAKAAHGDESARRRIVEVLLDKVAVTVRYLAAGDPDADDYIQLAMIEILASIGTYKGMSTLESWAEKISVRTAMRQIRKRRWRGKIVTHDPEKEAVDERPAPERQLARHRMSRRIAEIMDTLSPERRQALTMRLVLGYSIEEISGMTGWKVNTVRARLGAARRLLRPRILRDPVLREFRELESK
jgi:RNA polymerase sigma-70 factor (ECF subfamily)